MSDRKQVTITMELTDAQAIAVESLLAVWNQLAGQGSSRWTAFYADGDGNFHPKATVDGRTPQLTDLLDLDQLWVNGEFRIDFDAIAWKLREAPNA